MRAVVLLLLLLAACQPADRFSDVEQQALAVFRAEYGGVGRREPWTTKQPIGPDGDWVVREVRNLQAETREQSLLPNDRASGIEWRGQVIVTFWSRVVDAGAWRGPELPSSWDQFAVAYRAKRTDGKITIESAQPTSGS